MCDKMDAFGSDSTEPLNGVTSLGLGETSANSSGQGSSSTTSSVFTFSFTGCPEIAGKHLLYAVEDEVQSTSYWSLNGS